MKLELRNIKYAAFASQETDCYSARLYADGQPVADVGNDGHGGADHCHPINDDLLAQVQAHVAKMPPVTSDGFTYAESLETVCGGLLNDYLVARDLKRLLKRRIAIASEGKILTLSKLAPTPDALARCAASKPEWIILNTLPFDEALRLYEGV